MFKDSLCRLLGSSASRTKGAGAIATAAVLALGLAACGGPSNTGSTDGTSSSESKTIRFGYVAGVDGRFVSEVAKVVFDEMGYKVEEVPMAFEALIPSLQSGRIDAAGSGLYITPTRCLAAAFSEPTQYYANSMAVKKGNPKNLKTDEDIARTGATMGVLAGSDGAKNAMAAGVKESQISTYQDLITLLDAINAGRVDAAPYENVTLGQQLAKPAYSGLELTPPTNPPFDDGKERPYSAGIAFPKKDTELAKEYSEKQAELFKEGTKIAEVVKQESVPENSVPKGDGAYTMAEYCAHAGS
jgi:polar amino acid transport system substrate-binding protein